MARPLTLRRLATIWVLSALLAGAGAMWLVMQSQAAWEQHLQRAYQTGFRIHASLRGEAPTPEGITIARLPDAPVLTPGWRVTRVSLGAGPPGQPAPGRVEMVLMARATEYPLADLALPAGAGPGAVLGSVSRLMASYCGAAVMFAQVDGGGWARIAAPGVWGCSAAPPDRRIWAGLLLVGALALILGSVGDTAQSFVNFAEALRGHRSATAPLPETGPDELRQTATAVNALLVQDRASLANRAMVLSAVSHDLGTPATRLRLRADLIPDSPLRERIRADIEEMTLMIDGALSYTRAEIGTEPYRELSLSALVAAVVDDYQDVGLAVRVTQPAPKPEKPRRSTAFSQLARTRAVPDGPVIIRGQPMSLRRALSNLIDNALKYGRAADLTIEAGADFATVVVSDQGSVLTEDDVARLTAAFERGPNAGTAPGVGLGLAIVSTIAAQHGGTLEFASADGGLAARLKLSRHWA